MNGAIARLTRLEKAYGQRLKMVERSIVSCLAKRQQLAVERAAVLEAIDSGSAFLDLAMPAAMRRLANLDAEMAAAAGTLAELRRRASSCALRSRRAARLAAGLMDQAAKLRAREALAELAGRIAVDQACGK